MASDSKAAAEVPSMGPFRTGKQLCPKCCEYRGYFHRAIIYLHPRATVENLRDCIIYANNCTIKDPAGCVIIGSHNHILGFGNVIWGTENAIGGDNQCYYDPDNDMKTTFLSVPITEKEAKERRDALQYDIFKYRTDTHDKCAEHGVLYMNRSGVYDIEPLSQNKPFYMQKGEQFKARLEAELKERADRIAAVLKADLLKKQKDEATETAALKAYAIQKQKGETDGAPTRKHTERLKKRKREVRKESREIRAKK